MLNKGLDPKHRVPYLKKNTNTDVNDYGSLTPKEFKELLEDRINFYCNKDYNKGHVEDLGNMLIFGAPGIGKSTIPREVVMEYNKNKEGKDKIALITVNCANINPGELLMPAFPRENDVLKYIKDNADTLSDGGYLKKMTSKGKQLIKDMLQELSSKQHVANTAPQPWLPCYRQTGNKYLDKVMDIAANGGKMEGEGSVTEINPVTEEETEVPNIEKTGSGGIILFDDFLRAKPSVVNNLTYFLFERRFGEWKLGSKWFIIACANRPCDDKISAYTWKELGDAARDRWLHIFHLDPDPEQWKEWARKKGFDETLLKFIFDKSPDNLIDGEYTRWHRVVHKDYANTDSHKPVTPRTWMGANDELINFMQDHKNEDRFKDGFSISKMTPDEVVDTINIFDDDFLEELKQWLETNCNNVDLEKILKDQ